MSVSRISRIWAGLVAPATSVPPDQRRSAQLLASLLFVLVVAGFASGLIQLALVEGFAPTFARMQVALLTDAGLVVVAAGDGAEARRLHVEHRAEIQVIVSDVVLPDLTGPEIVAQLDRPELPVIFVSGYAPALHRGDIAALRARLLSKPFTAEQLIDEIHAALRTTAAA